MPYGHAAFASIFIFDDAAFEASVAATRRSRAKRDKMAKQNYIELADARRHEFLPAVSRWPRHRLDDVNSNEARPKAAAISAPRRYIDGKLG